MSPYLTRLPNEALQIVAYCPWILIRKNQTLAAIMRDQFTTTSHNSNRDEDDDVAVKLSIIF
jgi:hypothetical protein